MKNAAYEYWLTVTDCDGTDTVAMGSAEEAQLMVGRVLGEFIANGYKVACPLNNPGYWVAMHGNYMVDVRLIVTGVN